MVKVWVTNLVKNCDRTVETQNRKTKTTSTSRGPNSIKMRSKIEVKTLFFIYTFILYTLYTLKSAGTQYAIRGTRVPSHPASQ